MAKQNHSVNLGAWDPYTKKYIGISHVSAEQTGFRFDERFPGTVSASHRSAQRPVGKRISSVGAGGGSELLLLSPRA
jgi:hypothetical protein